VDGGNGYAGQSTQRIHFGLGTSTTIASIQVRWPSGTVQTVNAPIDKITTVQESAASGSR